MRIIGIGGAAPVEELLPFVELTGTGDFTHLDDNAGDLWSRFGTEGRSTFMFINDDGAFELTSYGVADAERLVSEIERLLAS